MTFVPLLAHPLSSGNGWIGPMTVASWLLFVVFVLVVSRRVEMSAPGDLLLPLAAAVLVAGLGGSLGDFVTDQGPWSVPAGLVVLVALVIAAFSEIDYPPASWRTFAVVGIAIVASVALATPLERTWFPEDAADVPLPALEDAEVAAEVVEPLAEDGTLVVRVTLVNATFGGNTPGPRPADPETGLAPRFQVGAVYLTPPIPEECVEAEECTEAEFELTLPPGVVSDPPESLVVELLTTDQLPFAPPLQARFELEPAG